MSTIFFIMHFLCISFILFTYYVYVCTWFSLFLDWCTFFDIYPLFMFMFIYFFVLTIFFLGYWVLSIASLVVPPFQKVCGNCHITDVIISPMGSVHWNIFHLKSMIQKSRFFCDSIATNDELVLLTIEGKWLEAILRMNYWICFIQNKFNFAFQFAFMVNFNCCPHLPLLAFKKTSNNLFHKQKPIWSAKV